MEEFSKTKKFKINYFSPRKAKKIADISRKVSAASEIETKTALDHIRNSAELGEYSTNLFYNEEVAKNLKVLGYEVSDKWLEKNFYKSDMMTVSWGNIL